MGGEKVNSMTDTDNMNIQLIANEVKNISQRVSLLPTTDQVKVIVNEGIQGHEDRCVPRQHFGSLADRTAEMTGEFKVLKDTGNLRRSLAPAARAVGLDRVPPFVWKALAVLAIGVAGKFGIDNGGELLRSIFGL